MIFPEATPLGVRPTHLDHLLVPEQKTHHPLQTILLAEDDDDLRFVMECSLRVMGYRVIACADGAIALAEFHAHRTIDILVTDYDMPRLTGLELARELTANRRSLPVMIVTGSNLSDVSMHEIQERNWTFIRKPCTMPDLESTLGQILRSDRPSLA